MAEKKTIDVIIRPKRQITIPKEVCEQMGIDTGDMLELALEDSVLVAKPKKTVALEALQEIREAFKRSGITEEELQNEGSRIRQEVIRERYADET